MVELIFHELTHHYGTEDDDSQGVLMNAHTIDGLMNGRPKENAVILGLLNGVIKTPLPKPTGYDRPPRSAGFPYEGPFHPIK